jgi:predicted RNase H-like nuclease (RuvC/YqgF family)
MRKKRQLSDVIRQEHENQSDSSASAEKLENSAPEEQTTAKKTTQGRSRASKPAENPLDKEVTRLTAAVEAAEKRASELGDRVASLEGELETQKKLAATLQDKLQQASEREKELEEQKKLVAKLYSKVEDAKNLESELEEQKKLAASLSEQLKQASEQKSSLNTVASSSIQHRPIGRLAAVNQTSTTLTNEVIGWFD